MFISRVAIKNFRNFANISFEAARNVVLLGENKVGKSNLLFALRLVLDPSLSDSARKLRREDFWDGIETPGLDDRITISVDLSDFESNENQVALLADHLVSPEPMVARLTYVWEPKKTLKAPPKKESDYDFFIYGGDRPENRIFGDIRRRLPMELLHALRDCEADLARWTRSPLRPLLDLAASQMKPEDLAAYAKKIGDASDELTKATEIIGQTERLIAQLRAMVGQNQALDLLLRFAPVDPDRLIRSLRIFIDGGKRGVSDASLGSNNILFFALKMLEFQQMAKEGDREHTFLAIEEPEAHLHPTLQRLIFRNYLRLRDEGQGENKLVEANVWVTTHSPHIASVAPIGSFVVLRSNGKQTSAVSTAKLELGSRIKEDLERYLDISRAEMLFARGVILVEGDAEQFLIPILAKGLGFDLDELGIAVCSVSGTNFNPYIRFLAELKIPFSVVTDRDPTSKGKTLGIPRVMRLVEILLPGAHLLIEGDDNETVAYGENHGIFLNSYTFEIDLFSWGIQEEMSEAMSGLKKKGRQTQRMVDWSSGAKALQPKQFLADIDDVSKGRFAQRLSAILRDRKSAKCPAYIRKAIEHVERLARNA